MKVILIGAGISSAVISLLLRRQFGPGVKLVAFDKGRAIGKKQKLILFKVHIIFI
jgi:L-2-hydroxyglutarate oxidase LhgO